MARRKQDRQPVLQGGTPSKTLRHKHPEGTWSLFWCLWHGVGAHPREEIRALIQMITPQASTLQEIPSARQCYCSGCSTTMCSRTGFRALPSDPSIPKADCQFKNGVEPLKATAASSGTAAAVRKYQKAALWTQLSVSLASLPEEQAAEQ